MSDTKNGGKDKAPAGFFDSRVDKHGRVDLGPGSGIKKFVRIVLCRMNAARTRFYKMPEEDFVCVIFDNGGEYAEIRFTRDALTKMLALFTSDTTA